MVAVIDGLTAWVSSADVDPATAACRALRAAELPPDLALRLERIAPAFVAAYVLALEAADLSDD